MNDVGCLPTAVCHRSLIPTLTMKRVPGLVDETAPADDGFDDRRRFVLRERGVSESNKCSYKNHAHLHMTTHLMPRG